MKRRTILLPGAAALVLLTFGCMSQQQRSALLEGPYTLQADHSAAVEELLRAGGYSWTSHQLTSTNFPAAGTGKETLSAVLVEFSPQADLEWVTMGQAARGLRPADLAELLAFGQSYPEVQNKVPVIALGSSASLLVNIYDHVTDDNGKMLFLRVVQRVERLYPFLSGGLAGRVVGLEWLDDPSGYGTYYALFVGEAQLPQGGRSG